MNSSTDSMLYPGGTSYREVGEGRAQPVDFKARCSSVYTQDVNKANASIKSINTSLPSMEQSASTTTRGASASIDSLTVSMVKGATVGNLFANGIKTARTRATSWTPCRCPAQWRA